MHIKINRSLSLRGIVNRTKIILNYLKPPFGYISWLNGGITEDTINELTDNVGTLDPFKYTANNCKEFDGVGDVLKYNTGISSDNYFGACTISGWFKFNGDPSGTNQVLWSFGAASYRLLHVSNTMKLNATTDTGFNPDGDVWYLFEVDYSSDGSAIQFRATPLGGGTTIISVSAPTGTIIGGTTFSIGAREISGSYGLWFNGKCSYVCLDGAGARGVCYKFASGPSYIEYDVSGNGNNGTYTSTSGLETMSTTDDNIQAHNISNGFTLYTHATMDDILVPYANGSPISSPSVPIGYSFDSEHRGGYIHNGAESTITATDASLDTDDFWSDGLGTLLPKTKAEILANNDDTDTTRSSYDDNGNIVDIVLYSTSLIGEILKKLNIFLNRRHS